MDRKLSLIHILVHQQSFFYHYHQFRNRREFQSWLRYNPISYTKTIWILYSLGKRIVLQLELRPKESHTWQVSHMNKPMFEFTCFKSKEFMKVFEQHLYEELEKRPMIRTRPPTGKRSNKKDEK